MTEKQSCLLHQLAGLYNIQTIYHDVSGNVRHASPASLFKILEALGVSLETSADLSDFCRKRRQELWMRRCEPVSIIWDREPAHMVLRLPANLSTKTADFRLDLENGEFKEWQCSLELIETRHTEEIEGVQYHVKYLHLPGSLPFGYHNISISLPGQLCESLLISAPRQAFYRQSENNDRSWGVFLPLHALHSRQSLGAGDFGDLSSLLNWVYKLGGKYVGILPLLPVFLDKPYDHSPYAPASRLFWNEFFLNIKQIPEFKQSSAVQELISSPAVQEEIKDLQNDPLVDYRRGMKLKRRILSSLARYCSVSPARDSALKEWVKKNPHVQDYARFRAAGEKQKAGWPLWPVHMQEGNITPEDYNTEDEYYHLYVQWLAEEQLSSLAGRFKGPGQGIYMDLPLGVHHDSYDVWRNRSLFVLNASCGAPPDPFSNGQDWGFPPLNPDQIRRERYRYFIDTLQHHLKYAGLLRLDHVMGLHQLFWIPSGLPAGEGVYVKYQAEEFYAILNLESHRYQTPLVGEDLGTVPDYVRSAMTEHNLHRMYVLPFEQKNPVPKISLACLNTHDMLPFASYWLQEDLDRRFEFCTYLHKKGWIKNITVNLKEILMACMRSLACSEARFLLINLEDLWLETAPQNIPSASTYPNWQRKAHFKIEEIENNTAVTKMLREINDFRTGPEKGPKGCSHCLKKG